MLSDEKSFSALAKERSIKKILVVINAKPDTDLVAILKSANKGQESLPEGIKMILDNILLIDIHNIEFFVSVLFALASKRLVVALFSVDDDPLLFEGLLQVPSL